jgi:hypothetical protein
MQTGLSTPSRYTAPVKILLGALIVVYLINTLSPLRLHVDMLRYFAIKDCIELGCPPDSFAATDYLPYGYTALLLALSKLGILNSFTIILINCAFLFAALYFIVKIFGVSVRTEHLILFTLLNWTAIKFVTHPLSEMQFLFFSSVSVYTFYRYTQSNKILFLLLAFVFCGLAFLTRTVGIALLAALLSGLAWKYRQQLILLIKNNKILIGIAAVMVVVVILFSKQFGLDHYTGVFTKQFTEGVGFADILKWHFTEWTEIILNTSIVKLFPYIGAPAARLCFLIAGILIFAGFVYLLFIRKNNIPFIVKAYLFFYTLLMFNWPFYDPRFWLPVLPFIIGVILQQPLFTNKGWTRVVFYPLAAFYILMGVVSAGYLTNTSLNKKLFARTHANGVYRNEYETVFFGKPQSDTAKVTDPVILSVIKRYN